MLVKFLVLIVTIALCGFIWSIFKSNPIQPTKMRSWEDELEDLTIYELNHRLVELKELKNQALVGFVHLNVEEQHEIKSHITKINKMIDFVTYKINQWKG